MRNRTYQGYSYEYAPPLWICPPLVNRLSKTRGGIFIKWPKSAEGREIFRGFALFCCENPFWNTVFVRENITLKAPIRQIFRLRRAVHHTNKLSKQLDPEVFQVTGRCNLLIILRVANTRSYTRENIRNRTYAAYKYFGVWYFSPLTPPLATNLPCFTTKKISRRSKKNIIPICSETLKNKVFRWFFSSPQGKILGYFGHFMNMPPPC